MPTEEQRATAREQIEDVIGRRYIQGDGDMCGCLYAPEGGGVVGATYCYPPGPGDAVPFSALDETSRVELLATYVSWEGFDFEQDGVVIRNVLDGRPPGEWMDGIDRGARPTGPLAKAPIASDRDRGETLGTRHDRGRPGGSTHQSGPEPRRRAMPGTATRKRLDIDLEP